MDEMKNQTSLGALVTLVNIAEKLDEDKLVKIGRTCQAGFETDSESRREWEVMLDEWTKLAKQTIEPRSWPWPNASNIKYPLLSTAAMQFAARAYPSLIPSDGKIVKAKTIGKDQTGEKTEIALAVSTYMSYQLMEEMQGWEEDMDKLLIMLPIVGTVFKKTYWDSIKKVNCSKIVLPKNLVVDYWTKSLRDAARISEILELSERQVTERQMAGLWLEDLDLGAPSIEEATRDRVEANTPAVSDETTPYIFIEQHCYIDLDDDGYQEPYIVTFHRDTAKVVRIVANYDETTMYLDSTTGELQKIEPIQYYTKFGFVPNPDGSFYDIGFGVLLGPINESVNTLINQLVDAGTLNNLQSGFIGKGLRLRMGETRFQPGEWKVVNSTGDDLKKQIVPMPSKEPSAVLFQLMGALITSGKELASVAEIFVGKMPGQNTPATTTMASIEQGMKVFTAVYKRIYRSLSEEFEKLYRLNHLYLNPNTYVEVVGMSVGPESFDRSTYKIYPGADPTAVSQTEKLLKAQGLMELLPTGILDPIEVVRRVLEAQEQPNYEKLFNQAIQQSGQMPPPPPDPKLLEMQMKGQLEQQGLALKAQEQTFKSELAMRDQQFQQMMQEQKQAQEMEHKKNLALIDAATKEHMQKIFSAEGVQKIIMRDVEHKQKLQQTKEQATAKTEAIRAQKPSKGETTK